MLTDVDILKLEPSLFSDVCFSSQKLCGGTNGLVAGTQFTTSGVDFNASQIAAGHVIWLESADGTIKGGFEIVSVIDSTHLTVSILRNDPADTAIPVGSESGLTWTIKTFNPQITINETRLSHRLRCLPGWAQGTITLDEMINPETVKLIALHLLLSDLYGAMYGTSPAYTAESASAAWKAHYEKRTWYRQQAESLIRQL